MNSTNINPASQVAGEAPASALHLAGFSERAAQADGPIEAWVACTVIDKQAQLGEQQLTIGEVGEDASSAEAQCRFPGVVEHRLDRTYKAEINLDEMVGSSMALRLRAVPCETFQIVDVEPDWIEEEIRAANRACLRELADTGLLELQRNLPEPDAIRRICIVVDEDDPAGQDAQHRLAEADIPTTVELAQFNGGRGRLSLITALNRAQSRVEAGEIDLVLIIHTGPDPDGVYALHNDHVAELVCQMGVPVVIGITRPPLVSLLHTIAFAAFDCPLDAIDAVLGLVRRVREDEAKQARILGWSARIRARMEARS